MSSKQYYTDKDILIMKVTRDSIHKGNDRTEKIIEFAREAGVKKLGVAYCNSVSYDADKVIHSLTNEGFEVESVHCKYDRLKFNDLIDGYKGTACNPAGQAAYLAERQTELNIVMGLCVGHDMVFYSKSEAPTTTLTVKDH